MRVIVDTSAYSQYMKGNDGVKDVIQRADQILFNPIVLGELRSGFTRGRIERGNAARLQDFLNAARVEVVEIDADSAEFYAAIRTSLMAAGTPIPTNDMWIAASAMQHGLRVLTTDKHFHNVKQIVVEYIPVQ